MVTGPSFQSNDCQRHKTLKYKRHDWLKSDTTLQLRLTDSHASDRARYPALRGLTQGADSERSGRRYAAIHRPGWLRSELAEKSTTASTAAERRGISHSSCSHSCVATCVGRRHGLRPRPRRLSLSRTRREVPWWPWGSASLGQSAKEVRAATWRGALCSTWRRHVRECEPLLRSYLEHPVQQRARRGQDVARQRGHALPNLLVQQLRGLGLEREPG